MLNIFEKLRRFDAYPKTLEDVRIKTYGGAVGKNLFFVNFVQNVSGISSYSDKPHNNDLAILD